MANEHWKIPRKSCGQLEREAAESHCDNVNHPYHYTQGGIECIDAMESAFGREAVEKFCLCNAFKYLFRCLNKEDVKTDLAKADWYIGKYMELTNETHEEET